MADYYSTATLRNHIESRNKESRGVKNLDSSTSPLRKVAFIYFTPYRGGGGCSMLYRQLTHLACMMVDSGCPSRPMAVESCS